MRGVWLVSLVGAVGLAACDGDPTAPGAEIAQAYVLRSIAGDALPAVFRDGDFTTLHLLADTLFLRTDGTGYEVRLQELVDKSDGSKNRYTSENNLEYTLQDGRIEIAYECADMGSCIAPPHLAGAVTITGIVFDLSLGRVPLLFERLDPSES